MSNTREKDSRFREKAYKILLEKYKSLSLTIIQMARNKAEYGQPEDHKRFVR